MSNKMTLAERMLEMKANSDVQNSDVLNSNIGAQIVLVNESVVAITTIIRKLVLLLELDEERVERSISVAKSLNYVYGKVASILNVLASIYAWPIESKSEAAEVAERQQLILASFPELREPLLMGVKSTKGSGTFVNATGELIEAVEPQSEEYQWYIVEQCRLLGIYIDAPSLDDVGERWSISEDKAAKKLLKAVAEAESKAAKRVELI